MLVVPDLVVDKRTEVPHKCLVNGFVVVVIADREGGKAP